MCETGAHGATRGRYERQRRGRGARNGHVDPRVPLDLFDVHSAFPYDRSALRDRREIRRHCLTSLPDSRRRVTRRAARTALGEAVPWPAPPRPSSHATPHSTHLVRLTVDNALHEPSAVPVCVDDASFSLDQGCVVAHDCYFQGRLVLGVAGVALNVDAGAGRGLDSLAQRKRMWGRGAAGDRVMGSSHSEGRGREAPAGSRAGGAPCAACCCCRGGTPQCERAPQASWRCRFLCKLTRRGETKARQTSAGVSIAAPLHAS